MKVRFCFSLLLGVFLTAACAYAQTPLTNDAILRMVKAGLSEEVILATINGQPAKFALGADELVQLKKDGVSDKILAAMVKKADPPAPLAAPAAPAPAEPAKALAAPPPAVATKEPGGPAPPLSSVHKIFIDKMDNDLDQYLRAEFAKQFKDRRVTVVLDPNEADAILTGVNEESKGTGAKITGRYLGLHDVATGTLTLLDKQGTHILWSDEAGDRSLLFGMMRRGGQRKVADRLVSKFKKAIESAR
jgi:hypothetical protein